MKRPTIREKLEIGVFSFHDAVLPLFGGHDGLFERMGGMLNKNGKHAKISPRKNESDND